MIILRDDDPISAQPSVVAIGVFDGAHRGHQALLAELVTLARARGALATVITFDPHPASVVAPTHAPALLQTLPQRLEALERAGVDQVRLITFDDAFAEISAASFIADVIAGQLRAVAVLAGDDTQFGKGRSGTVAVLRELAPRFNIEVFSAPSFGDGVRFSSSRVRASLRVGDVVAASDVLGRPFVLRGEVVHGDARGRTIGYPTANVAFGAEQALPALGIYAGAVWAAGQWRCGAISVGKRPHFYDDGIELVEVHIPDFSGDLYGDVIDVAFLEWLRGEAAFDSLEALLAQIGRDVARSQEICGTFTPSSPFLLR